MPETAPRPRGPDAASPLEPGAARPDAAPPRDAATLILARRDGGGAPRVLMGQRGSAASFMPSKYVFPGGALDADDRIVTGPPLHADCVARLEKFAPQGMGQALSLAAIRETFEETGLIIGRKDASAPALARSAPAGWRDFFARGFVPATDALSFVFRAITPPSRPKRFDARFFLAEASHVQGDLDEFGGASGELNHLRWLTLREARELELPLITEVVLAEVEEILAGINPPPARPVPFFHHDRERSWFDAL